MLEPYQYYMALGSISLQGCASAMLFSLVART